MSADALLVAAGAGMGVDSGLPDFRGKDAFWRAYPALARAQIDFRTMASPGAFRRNPERAWGFYGHRLQLYRDTQPHDGFEVLRRWGEAKPGGAFVYTGNVDGQFQKSGFADGRVHECHGSILWLQCIKPCTEQVWLADELLPGDLRSRLDVEACRWTGPLPACPRCGSLLRPNVLMFNDSGWISKRYDAMADRLEGWLDGAHRLVVVELGAGTAIPAVRSFVQRVQRLQGARLVRINPREWRVPTPADVSLGCGALEGLQAIDAAMAKLPSGG